jgi:hypothetical protein
MKNLLALAFLAVSFNVHAIPPPPPPPDAIGSLSADIKISVRVTDVTKCQGYFCASESQECQLTAKIPVLPANPYGGRHYMPTTKSADGKQYATCEKEFGGDKHYVSMTVYITKNEATGELILFSDSRSGKSGNGEASTDNNASTRMALPSNQSSFSIESALGADIHGGKNPLTNTNSDILMSISFPSLEVQAP